MTETEFPDREIVFSTKQTLQLRDYPIRDIDEDAEFTPIFRAARNFTMTGKDAMYALYQAVQYVVAAKVPGDFVECGVWRGGSSLVAALSLRALGDQSRILHLFDTFEGMAPPTAADVDRSGGRASDYIDRYGDEGKWCYVGEDEVRAVFAAEGFDEDRVRLYKGDVVDTLPASRLDTISVLRLDTDWYESTRVELEVLYPKLSPGGVLIIDDYGHWRGARQAVDEYFAKHRPPLLNRVNDQVRLAIKV